MEGSGPKMFLETQAGNQQLGAVYNQEELCGLSRLQTTSQNVYGE